MANSTEVEVRATVKLSGLRVGQRAIVDVNDPYIRACLAGQMLVPVEEPRQREEAPE